MHRLVFNLVILFGVFLFPWWFFLVGAIVGVFYFRNYYELIIFGLLADLIYSSRVEIFSSFEYVHLASSVALLFVAFNLKKVLKYYNDNQTLIS